jgi:hypothetical protein
MPIILDIETEPRPRAEVELTLPDELRNPVMPDEIANPVAPDLVEKCPDYGLKKATEALQKARAAVAGPEGSSPTDKEAAAIKKAEQDHAASVRKRGVWMDEKTRDFLAKSQAAKDGWEAGVEAKREKAFRDAALDAKTGFIRLAVVLDASAWETLVFLLETQDEAISQVMAPDAFGHEVQLRIFSTEKAMTAALLGELQKRMDSERALEGTASMIGYYIKEFDLPFIFRRAWINGFAQAPLWRSGRYWSNEIVDIHEVFSFGAREYRVGGLDGLSETLGAKNRKLGDGAGFAEWYARSPVEGVQYCINDCWMTADNARKMGVLS